MVKRYPHTGYLKFPGAATPVQTSGILGQASIEYDVQILTGRFERKNVTGGTYKAIFYTKHLEGVIWTQNADAILEHEGRIWNVVDIMPFQTHTEIWLS